MLFRSLVSLYNPILAATLVSELVARKYSGWRLLYWFWHAKTYDLKRPVSDAQRSAAVFLGLLMLGQIALGARSSGDSLGLEPGLGCSES
jgi:hypothetical protein